MLPPAFIVVLNLFNHLCPFADFGILISVQRQMIRNGGHLFVFKRNRADTDFQIILRLIQIINQSESSRSFNDVFGFAAGKIETVRLVLFSGVVMPVKQLNIWRKYQPEAKYVNLYGPTEITCNCMYYEVDREFSPGETLPL